MSYNYDYNPWDDATTPGAGQASGRAPYQPAQTSGGGGGSYASGSGDATYTASGYSNPAAQYVAQDAWADTPYGAPYDASGQQQQQQQQQPGQYDQADSQQQQQQQQYGTQEASASAPAPGFVARLLRAHVPLCGACMDLTSPLLDRLLKYVNRDLLPSKIFYFFFYSAFGSLFPLMGVYFKQLGMNPSQVGILTGVRPFIEIFSAPFWNSLAERFQKSRMILLFSLISWIVFTYSLAHIRPPASACVAFNDTDYVLYTPYSANDLSNYDVGQLEGPEPMGAAAGASGSSSEPTAEARDANEVFMNKMPQQQAATGAVAENKEGILINEENVVNDQGRRRRRRREVSHTPALRPRRPYEQIPRPAAGSRGQAAANDDSDDGYGSSFERPLELEDDFEDVPVGLEGARFKRSLAGDDPLGDSESAESERADELEGGGSGSDDDGTGRRSSASESGPEEREGDEQQAEEDNEVAGGVKQRKPAKQHQGEPSGAGSESESGSAPGGGATIQSTTSSGAASANKTKRVYKQRHKTPPTHIVGMSPITVEYAVNYNKDKHKQFVTPMFSTIVYKLDDIKEVFFLLLLLISLGEFFSAPAITIADSTTLSCLGENTDLYGRQRMFGSIGWAITLMLVGMALDNSRTIADHPCGPHQRERSYHVCFTIFSLLMGCALVAATQFKFNYSAKAPNSSGTGAGSSATANSKLVTKTLDDGTNGTTVVTTTVDANNASANIDDLYASTRPREIFNTAPPVNAPPPGSQQAAREKFEFIDKWKSAVFAQSTWELPEWVGVFRQFRNTMHLTYLFITWFLGCGVGLVFTFLFWHLQDVGGTPTLFGICSVINHISEILAYFFSSYFIKRYGHTKVLSVGLGCNVIRFLYVAFLSNPYYALPFELVQGITHAACFAACCSYMSHVSKPELKASTQGVMQGLHNGIGRACGALLGGYMINAIGSRASFCIYGLLSGCVLGGFLYARKGASDDGDVKVIDDENLGNIGAPQGVPEKVRF